MSKKIVLTGGGTGGHLFPLVAVAQYLRMEDESVEFLYLGPKGRLEKKVMSKHNIKQKTVISGKLRRYFSLRYLVDLIKFPIGVLQAMWHLLVYMPDVVFAKGGYASVPVVFVSWLYRIPILIHESDAKPGMANEFLGNLATKIAISFDRAKIHFPPSKTFLTGIPVGKRVLGGNAEEAKKILGIKKSVKPVIFIIGGSQGARFINKKILKFLPKLLDKYQIIHQTGDKEYESVISEAKRQGFKPGYSDYFPVPFIGEEIKHFYALADVVIARAGATTIAELAANEKLTILVPITNSANNHQKINAFEVARLDGAIVLEEMNFKENLLLLKLHTLLTNEKVRIKLKEGIKRFYNPQATKLLADAITELSD